MAAALVTVASAALIAGVVTTVGAVRFSPAGVTRLPAETGHGPFPVGVAVRTAVGVVTVTGAETLTGPSTRDLAGAVHGIQNLVADNQTQVQVSLRIANDSTSDLTWGTGSFALLPADGAVAQASTSTLPGGTLRPGDSVEGTLGFVTTSNGAALLLRLPAAGGGVVTITVGRAVSAPAGTTGGSSSHVHN